MGNDSFLVTPENFYVLYENNPSCWRRPHLNDDIQSLELIRTDSLEVKGSTETTNFKPGRKYIAMFVVLMKEDAMFETPTNFTLILPHGQLAEQSIDLKSLQPNRWVFLKTGEFLGPTTQGNINFSLTNFDPNWKSGLVIGGVYFQHAC